MAVSPPARRMRQHKAIAIVIFALSIISWALLLLGTKLAGVRVTQAVSNDVTQQRSTPSTTAETTSLFRISLTKTPQRSNENEYFSNPRKSRLVLHSGPHKTGTTFLQCVLQSELATSHLNKDRYVYLGKFNNACGPSKGQEFGYVKNIMANETHVHPAFIQTMESIYQQGFNVIIVTESWHPLKDEQYRLLAKTLQEHWDIQHVVAYRPLYEWIPSFYSEVFRPMFRPRYNWDGSGTKTWAEIPPMTLTPDNEWTYGMYFMLSYYRLHPTRQVMDAVSRLMPSDLPVTVVHLNNLPQTRSVGDPYLIYFLCQVVPNATQSCHLASSNAGVSRVKEPNPSYDVDADRLASAAVQQGLLARELDRTRATTLTQKELKSWMSQMNAKENTTSLTNPWRTCPSQYRLNSFLELSVELEEQVLERRLTPEERKRHAVGFQQYVEMGKFCALNVQELLHSTKWKSFFATMASNARVDHRKR